VRGERSEDEREGTNLARAKREKRIEERREKIREKSIEENNFDMHALVTKNCTYIPESCILKKPGTFFPLPLPLSSLLSLFSSFYSPSLPLI
jgi:hypothetical protein